MKVKLVQRPMVEGVEKITDGNAGAAGGSISIDCATAAGQELHDEVVDVHRALTGIEEVATSLRVS